MASGLRFYVRGLAMISALVTTASLPAMARTPHRGSPVAGLEPDMSSREYEALLGHRALMRRADGLDTILAVGRRNLEWLDAINATRAEGHKLELSTPATQRGYPIDAPTRSNPKIIGETWKGVMATMPAFMKGILLGNDPFITNLPLSDDDVLAQMRLVDRSYQNTSRWIMQEPYLDSYAEIMVDDVRGYYYLNNIPNLEQTLKSWASLEPARQAELHGWLVGECANDEGDFDVCTKALTASIAALGHPFAFHQKYVAAAAKHWDGYFMIPSFRDDVTWVGSNPGVFSIPFRDPGRADVKAWLATNIQDEWRWAQGQSAPWQLVLDFIPDNGDEATTHVNFVDGATPHVNGLAGSEITMDANRSIGEYSSRWTIRHEFGHVLGFPDCYLEFYDRAAGEMINYQLDITNLMCSRRGKFQQRHFDELKRVYFK